MTDSIPAPTDVRAGDPPLREVGLTTELSRDDADTVARLADLVTGFVASFGLHEPDRTPCGQPLPVSEAHAVLALSAGAPLTQTELAQQIRLTKSTVSRLVSNLQSRGWVQRGPDGTDGRAVRLSLTAAGNAGATALRQARRDRINRLFDRLPPAERDTVLHALAILREATDD